MVILSYIILGIGFFFAASWTLGLILRPDMRLKPTIASLIFWWVWVSLAALKTYSSFHLLWLMPLSLLLPMMVMSQEISTKGTTSVALIFIKSLFLWPLWSFLFYAIVKVLFSKNLNMHAAHEELLARLNLQEATLAHNELTYGGFIGTIPWYLHNGRYDMATPNKAYSDIEIVTSLYERIMELKGTPITKPQKAKYRMKLTKAMSAVLRDRTTDLSTRTEKAKQLIEPFCLEHIEYKPDNRANMDETILLMKRTVS